MLVSCRCCTCRHVRLAPDARVVRTGDPHRVRGFCVFRLPEGKLYFGSRECGSAVTVPARDKAGRRGIRSPFRSQVYKEGPGRLVGLLDSIRPGSAPGSSAPYLVHARQVRCCPDSSHTGRTVLSLWPGKAPGRECIMAEEGIFMAKHFLSGPPRLAISPASAAICAASILGEDSIATAFVQQVLREQRDPS